MKVALRGTLPDSGDDPVWFIPADITDRPVIAGNLSKHRREDLQLLAFQLTVALCSDATYPVQVLQGKDPPDRIIRVGGADHSLELTELTFSDIRTEFSQARHFGRKVEDQILSKIELYQHLIGRHVGLSIMNMGEFLSQDAQLVMRIASILQYDKGFVGDDVDQSKDLPQEWTSERGFYGNIGGINILVHRGQAQDRIVVSSLAQAEIRLSETIAILAARVKEKDTEANELLLITTGLPDGRGYVCTPDNYIFELLKENSNAISLSPQFLKAVMIHNWGTTDWFYIFRSQMSPPKWPGTKNHSV